MNQSYKISWCEKKTTTTGKAYIKATLEGVEGQVSIWSDFPNFANIMPGSSIVGDLKKNDKGYLTLYPPKANNGGASRGQYGGFKNQQVKELMQDKARNIEAAQDRSAWMWAKNDASTLLANKTTQYASLEDMADSVIRLATLIYNGEPIEPFSSKPKVVSTGDDISHDDINAELANY